MFTNTNLDMAPHNTDNIFRAFQRALLKCPTQHLGNTASSWSQFQLYPLRLFDLYVSSQSVIKEKINSLRMEVLLTFWIIEYKQSVNFFFLFCFYSVHNHVNITPFEKVRYVYIPLTSSFLFVFRENSNLKQFFYLSFSSLIKIRKHFSVTIFLLSRGFSYRLNF